MTPNIDLKPEEVKSTSIPDEYVRYLRYQLSRLGG
jgi:hypothetical protein